MVQPMPISEVIESLQQFPAFAARSELQLIIEELCQEMLGLAAQSDLIARLCEDYRLSRAQALLLFLLAQHPEALQRAQ